jgi:NAD(P)-dependent dehydrogenase (short-subunit alcohol dehydrogenase family)
MMKPDAFSLAGKVAMVTGAGQGLGREFARALAQAGADVAVAEINAETGPDAADELRGLGRNAAFIQTDVTEPASAGAAVDETVRQLGRLDVLVNNAGITVWGAAESVPLEDWRRVLDVNLNGLFHCCQAAGRVMLRAGGGSIINIASMSGLIANVPQPQASYNASKAAVIHLTRSLAVEWARHGVRVNAISPGYMDTPMARPYFEDPKYGGTWMSRIPMGRAGRPEELGPAVVFLAADASSYVTGSNLVIDGGYTAT